MLSILTETQRAVLDTITMNLHVVQSLQYLRDAGHEMSRAKYFRLKKKIEDMKLERMQYIAMHFQERHLEKIDKCELVEKLMWENYHAEKDPTKKVSILTSICDMQTYLSAYHDVTRYILEKGWKTPIFKTKEPYLSVKIEDEVAGEMKAMKDERSERLRYTCDNEDEGMTSVG
jgi:hypothetical protein